MKTFLVKWRWNKCSQGKCCRAVSFDGTDSIPSSFFITCLTQCLQREIGWLLSFVYIFWSGSTPVLLACPQVGAMVFPRVHVPRVNFGSVLPSSHVRQIVSFKTCILLARNKGSSINPSHLHVARAIYVWSRCDQCLGLIISCPNLVSDLLQLLQFQSYKLPKFRLVFIDRQIDRQVERQMDRQIDIYIQIDRQTDRQIDRQIDRQVENVVTTGPKQPQKGQIFLQTFRHNQASQATHEWHTQEPPMCGSCQARLAPTHQ